MRIDAFVNGPATAKLVSEFVVAYEKAHAADNAADPSAVDVEVPPEPEKVEEKPKRRRGRPKAAEPAKTEPEPAADETSGIAGLLDNENENGEAPPTKEDVTAAVKNVIEAKGLQTAVDVFKSFDKAKLSDFAESDYSALLDKLQNALD